MSEISELSLNNDHKEKNGGGFLAIGKHKRKLNHLGGGGFERRNTRNLVTHHHAA